MDVDGRSLVWHATRRLLDAGVDHVVILVDPSDGEAAAEVAADPILGGAVSVLTSGPDRPGSLPWETASTGGAPDVLLVHDATRAFAPVAMVHRVVGAVRAGAGLVIPVLPVVDTIRAVGDGGRASALVDRDTLRIVQTPQGYTPDVFRRARHAADRLTDPAAAVAAGATPVTVPGHADASRVLTVADIDQARRALGATPPPPAPGGADIRG
ncbi:IspD/TarI family cytidylyltransferase [Nakamurella deserti]|uniref:IspD/TarI family cytidylyltransferase n=1 Tax=Nakamurella deserti TaxID=2164074 RepID=UPI0013008AB8|nr:2-C-methyl-D-erythritol 4-phosphate cytidylyltransferase [Nakamurella deserti]